MLIIRGTWEVDGGNQSQNEESLNSGLEGEWKLHGEAEAGSREFAMREWGEAGVGNGKPVIAGGGGEWKLEPGEPGGREERIWGVELTVTPGGSSIRGGGGADSQDPTHAVQSWNRRFCCCDHLTEIKIFITIFGLINLGIMASGGVGFGLGLTNNHKEDTFKYLMVRKQEVEARPGPGLKFIDYLNTH